MIIETKEIIIHPSAVLISKTDKKGIITYASPDFLEISEYSVGELLGKPHNMIRHPDMPKEVFKELWDTIKAGRPWNGIVKNHSKNGKFYWVEATISPLWNKDEISGYISVRKVATKEKIQKAEKKYQLIREGKQKKNPILHLFKSLEKLGFSLRSQALYTLLSIPFFSGIFSAYFRSIPLLSISIIAWFSLIPLYFLYISKNDSKNLSTILDLSSKLAGGSMQSEIKKDFHKDDMTTEQKDILLGLKVILISFWGLISKIKIILNEHKNLSKEMLELSGTFSGLMRNQASSYEEITSTIKELAGSMDNVSVNINSQTVNLHMINYSIAEISESITINTQELELLGNTLTQSEKKAEEGKNIITELVQAMNNIKDASTKIESIVVFIQEISERTNLLSINASIESARAGENGKGFRVVATEISKLSEETSKSVNEIKKIIGDSKSTIVQGNQKVTEAVKTFDDINVLVDSLREHIDTITGKMLEQFEKALSIQKNVNEATSYAEAVNNSVKLQTEFTNEVFIAVESLANKTVDISLKAESLYDFSKQIMEPVEYIGKLINHIDV
ncbi:MAG: PAS domain-containing methyl-accepting chemotaxis protein [Leptospiraceae bacterium]|nr:PAS domain-containing methyl-accepting chemotaxis protein [Leptospiraceae bacterium]